MAADEAFFDGFLDDYFAEADDHLTAAADALLKLEAGLGHPAAERAVIDELFRYFHTLKAISAMVELRPAEQLAHHLEHYLRAIREGEMSLSPAGTNVLIEGTQRLEQIVAAHRAQLEQPSIGDLVSRIEVLIRPASRVTVAEPQVMPEPDGHRWRCTFTPTRELVASGIGVDAIRRRLGEIGTIIDAAPQVGTDGTIAFQFTLVTDSVIDIAEELRDVPVSILAADVPASGGSNEATEPEESDPPAERRATAASHVVRVDLGRLDHLMEKVADLVISRARLADSLSRLERHVPAVEWRAVQENAVAIDRQLRTLREGIMRIRLVPVGEIFRRMPFVVRDLAREMGKTVLLNLHGQSTEIDKYLIERMMDPVLHLVRNALSHGIETPDVRIARGKKPEGTILLSAATVGDVVTLEIADDGHGVDRASVAEKARQLGIPLPAGPLDDAALLSILCAPGFSTREETDRASGRGVGMAVVKETIEELSGTMTLKSEPGEGTRFIIQLPVTLAITDALIGRVGQESFAVPQGAVREVIDVPATDIRQLEGNEIVTYRESALSLIRLSRLFGIESTGATHFHVFVVGSGSSALGIAVDRIIGHREIVVRAIADPLVRVEGISGATDLGDGKVVLILDPGTLARLTKTRAVRAFGDAANWGRLQAAR
ncbi:MAG: chemotaxis protein CheA [Vicinamibacterales bacterium]